MPMKILALSGSLRQRSYNTAAIKALSALASSVNTDVEVSVFDGMGRLPLFNPDIEDQHIPEFEKLRLALAESDGLVISSPEYAHGVTGVIKNALDWLVSGEEFVNIPVMLINTSPRATHAQQALREIVTTMSGNIIDEACVAIPLLGSDLDADGILRDDEISKALKSSLHGFCEAINANSGPHD